MFNICVEIILIVGAESRASGKLNYPINHLKIKWNPPLPVRFFPLTTKRNPSDSSSEFISTQNIIHNILASHSIKLMSCAQRNEIHGDWLQVTHTHTQNIGSSAICIFILYQNSARNRKNIIAFPMQSIYFIPFPINGIRYGDQVCAGEMGKESMLKFFGKKNTNTFNGRIEI